MQRTTLVSLGLLTVLLASFACGDDKQGTDTNANTTTDTTDGTATGTGTTDSTTGTATDDPTAGTTDAPTTGTSEPTTGDACMESMMAPGAGADGDPCTSNGDCMSETCLKFTDAQADATCAARTMCSNTRITGTLFDFDTGQPIPMGNLRVVGAIAAIGDPDGAPGLVTAMSDGNGVVDVTTTQPISQALGIVGLVDGGAYYVTATGLAAPYEGTQAYGPLNGIHDIWGVPSAKLTEWSGYLEGDPEPEVAMALPLGDNGGVIGLVRQGATPVAGGVVVSEDGPMSGAIIRYLNEDGMGFGTDATSANGVFVIVGPGIGERFTVEVGGMPTDLWGTGGSAKGAAFVLIFNVP